MQINVAGLGDKTGIELLYSLLYSHKRNFNFSLTCLWTSPTENKSVKSHFMSRFNSCLINRPDSNIEQKFVKRL
jgi:hypothetical protein